MAGDSGSFGKEARYSRYQRIASRKFSGLSFSNFFSWYSAW